MVRILLAYLFAAVPIFSASNAFFAPKKAPLELSLTVKRQNLGTRFSNVHKKRSVTTSGIELGLIGSQTFYHAEVRFGSAENIVTLMVDTGSTSTWVVSKDVKCYGHSALALDPALRRREDIKENEDLAGVENGSHISVPVTAEVDQRQCTGHGFFDSESSTTFEEIPGVSPYSVQFQDSTFASGVWARDAISFGGVKLQNAPFALVGKTDNTIGILGLGCDNSKHIYEEGTKFPPDYKGFPHLLKEQGLVKRAVFSLYLNDHASESGSVLFGAVDHAKYSGVLQTVPLANYYSNYSKVPLFYDIFLDCISIESAKMRLFAGTSIRIPVNRVALLDSGSTLCAFSSDVLTPIADMLEGEWHEKVQLYAIDFEKITDKSVTFRISSIEISIPVSRLLVKISGAHYLGIMTVEHDRIVLGEEFLRHAYVVFDAEENTVSMAQARVSSENQIEYVLSDIPRAVTATMLSLGTDNAVTPEGTKTIPDRSEMAQEVHLNNETDITVVADGLSDDQMNIKLVSDNLVSNIDEGYAPKAASSTTDDLQARCMNLVTNINLGPSAVPIAEEISMHCTNQDEQSLGQHRPKQLADFQEDIDSKENKSPQINKTLSHVPTGPDSCEGITIEEINQILWELDCETSEEDVIGVSKRPVRSLVLGESHNALESFQNFTDQKLLGDLRKHNRTRKDTSKTSEYDLDLNKFYDEEKSNVSERTLSTGNYAPANILLLEVYSSHNPSASGDKELQKISANPRTEVSLETTSQTNNYENLTTLFNFKTFPNGTGAHPYVTSLSVTNSVPSKKCPFGRTEFSAAPEIYTGNVFSQIPKKSAFVKLPCLPMPATATTGNRTYFVSSKMIGVTSIFTSSSAFDSSSKDRNAAFYLQSFSPERHMNDSQNLTRIAGYNSLACETTGDAENKMREGGSCHSGESEKMILNQIIDYTNENDGESLKPPSSPRKVLSMIDSDYHSTRAINAGKCSTSCTVYASNSCSVLGTWDKTENRNVSDFTGGHVLEQSFVSGLATFIPDEEYGFMEVQSPETFAFEGSAIKSVRVLPFFVTAIFFGLLMS